MTGQGENGYGFGPRDVFSMSLALVTKTFDGHSLQNRGSIRQVRFTLLTAWEVAT